MQVAARAHQRTVAQRQIVALNDLMSVKVGIARGVGDLHGRDGVKAVRHCGSVVLRRERRVKVQHRGDALRHGLAGDDDDLPVRQLRRLLRGENDVLIVRQDKDRLRRGLLHGTQNILRGGVHGLPTLYDLIDAEVAEHIGKPRARANRDHAVLLRDLDGGVLLRLQLLLDLFQIVSGARGASGGEIVMLHPHIFDLRQLQRAVLLRLAQRVAGDIGMDMDLERLIVLADDKAVANAVEEMAQRLERDVLKFAHDEHRVERERNILRVKLGKVRLLVYRGTVCGADDVVAAQGGEHRLQNEHKAHAARVHNTGFFEHRVLVDGIFQRRAGGLNRLLHNVLNIGAVLCQRARRVGSQA